MTPADFLLAYLAIGASLSAVALVRLLLSGPSIAHIRRVSSASGLPTALAAMLAAAALVVVVVEYAVLWPVRWREALR